MNYADIVKKARRSFDHGKTRSIEFRRKQLESMLELIKDNTNGIIEALAKDLRKSKMESCMYEINYVISEIKILLENLNEWTSPEHPKKDFPNLMDQLLIVKEPYGVVLVLGAWNYPVQVSLLPFIGAIAAGNSVILKPSELAPNTANLLLRLIPKYLDNDCYHVVCGDVKETTDLLKERFDYIFFTGSPAVGKVIHAAANKYLTPITLELGGKCPVYLDETADIDISTHRILWGKCINAGQTCIAPDYLLCTKDVEKKFISAAEKVLNEFYGDKPQMSQDFCRIVNGNHFKRLEGLLQDVKVAIGGKTDLDDNYVSPTIVVDVKSTDPLMTQEIFGPILPIYTVNDHDDAIKFVNSREKPLSLYVFSNNKKVIDDFVEKTSSGGIAVNDTIVHAAPKSLPFGGVGNSGMGAYHGKATFDTFVHKKSTLVKNLSKFGEKLSCKRYPPYTDDNLKYITNMLSKKLPKMFVSFGHIATFTLGIAVAVIYNYAVKTYKDKY